MAFRRYWFEFKLTVDGNHPPGVLSGCGVTALDYNDAIFLLEQKVFKDIPLPEFTSVIENVSFNDLESNHVRPNIGILSDRGVWIPLGYK